MRFKRLMIILLACLLAWPLCAQASFSTDTNAIEEAAKSVLMLGNYVGDELMGTGSGFVAFDSQTLITNHHVIKGAQYIYASDDVGNMYELDKVYCVSESMDIAILGFKKPTALKPLALGTGNDLKRGEPVVAIGSPIGIKNTVSIGNVSAVYMSDNQPLIQITAPISHGSSGGALFDDAGRVIGVTSGGFEGGQNLNVSVQGSVPLALYAAWDGRTYHLDNWPSETPMDFAAGEKLAANDAPAFAVQTQEDWLCPVCGKENQMNFCLGCGAAKPQWQCACGQINVFKFCGVCGKSQETLLDEFNAALALVESGEYEKAVSALEALGDYNCGGLASRAGNNVAASDQIAKAYYHWGEALEKEKDYLGASLKYDEADGYADASEKMREMGYLYAGVCFDEGRYLAASEFYLVLGDYKDAYDRALESGYKLAETYISDNDEDEAVKLFTALDDYKDSADRIKEAYCHKGQRFTDLGSFGEAILAYEAAGDYAPAKEGLKRTHYLRAEALLTLMDYAEAIKAFEQAGDYEDAAERVKDTYYREGERYLSEGKYTLAQSSFRKAGDYKDAAERVKAVYYLEGEQYLSEDKFALAKTSFEKAGDYRDAPNQLQKIKFSMGMKSLESGKWADAIAQFKGCSADDTLIREKLTEAYKGQIQYYIDVGQISFARDCYNQGIEAGCALEETVLAAPQLTGEYTLKVLTMARDMGFIKKLDKNENTYDEKYTEGVSLMESTLGLNGDGRITLAEAEALENVIYPGSSGEQVKAVLEKLCDLGYIDKLNDDHGTYASKLKKSVQKAEKALGLAGDGILTPEEQTAILNRPVEAPGKVTNVKVKISKGDVTLTWSKVKGAKYYTIFRDGKQIGRTENAKYTDENATMGEFHAYEVLANKYTQAGTQKSWDHVYVEPVYESVSLKNIWGYSAASHIKVSGVRKESQMWDGDDLIMLVYKKIDGTKYRMFLRFENYNTGWDWDNGGIASQRGLDTINAKGRTDGYKRFSLHSSSYVVLNVSSVEWTY